MNLLERYPRGSSSRGGLTSWVPGSTIAKYTCRRVLKVIVRYLIDKCNKSFTAAQSRGVPRCESSLRSRAHASGSMAQNGTTRKEAIPLTGSHP